MVFSGEALDGRNAHDAGRELLSRLYREQTGKELPQILITDRGKPFFGDGSVHFSISHTKRHVFCALSGKPIGIDAEELDRRVDLKLARKILSSGELAQYDQAEDKRLALLTFWVLKEAAVKCSGQGLQGYPNGTDFSLEDPRVFTHSGCIIAIIED